MKSNFSKEEVQNHPHKSKAILILLVVFISFGVYANSLFNDLVYDDIQQVLENRWIRNVQYIPDILSKNVWAFEREEAGWHYYRPLMHLVYMANYHIFGLRPWGFHLVNVIFHTSISVLVFLITFNLLGKWRVGAFHSGSLPSLAAALLFATHPIHTEVVTWVAGIPELTFTFFGLLSLFFYMRADDGNGTKSNLILSLAFFPLALLSKETALILPMLLIVYDFAVRRLKVRIKSYIPYVVLCLLYLLVRFHVLGGFAPFKRHSHLSAYQYAINIFPLFAQYLSKLLFPVGLNAFYVFHPITSILEMKGVASLGVAAAFMVFALMLAKKKRMAFFGLCLIALPLIPALYIPALGENTFAERYLYLPSFGFVFLIALIAAYAEKRREAFTFFIIISGLVLCLYTLATVQRNRVWRNEYDLWVDTVKKSPDGATPHNNLGIVYNDRGETDRAIEQFQMALRLKPNYAAARNNLGLAYGKKGMVDRAIEQFRIALSVKPLSGTYVNLGIAYGSKGLIDQAIEQYRMAITLRPDNVDARVNLGIAYGEKGMIDKAIEQLQEAVRLNPADSYAHYNLANALNLKGLHDKAQEHLQKARDLQKSKLQ